MAIDTAMKRFSMLNVAAGPSAYPLGFEPDGAVDADDRAFLLKLYGGNAFDAPVALTGLRYGAIEAPGVRGMLDDAGVRGVIEAPGVRGVILRRN